MIRRLTSVVVVTGVSLVILALPAAADSGDGNPWLELGLQDSHGNPWHAFSLDVYTGSIREADEGQQVWALLMRFLWGTYHFLMGIFIYLSDWVMSLEWATWLATPLTEVGYVIEGQFDQLDIRLVVLSLLGLLVGLWMFRGKIGTGLGNLAFGLLILAMVSGFLANPISLVTDPEDGLIYNGRDAGYEIAATVSGQVPVTEDALTPEQWEEQQGQQRPHEDVVAEYRSDLSASMVDVLIRLPHQVINYGQVIDGTACEPVYDQAIVNTERRPHDVIHDANECPDVLYEYAHHPDVMSVMMAWQVMPAATLFFVVTLGLMLLLFAAVVGTIWSGIQIIWNGVLAALPGQSRAGLTKNLAGLVGGFVVIAGTIAGWIAWLSVIRSIMSMNEDRFPFVVRIWVFNILMLLGGIFLFLFRARVKKRLRQAAERLARFGTPGSNDAGGQRPAMVQKVKSAATRAATDHISRTVAGRTHTAATVRRPGPVRTTAPTTVGENLEASPQPQQTPAGPGPSPGTEVRKHEDEGAEVAPHPDKNSKARAEKIKARVKTGGKIGFHVALATMSGGASLVAKGAQLGLKAKRTHDTAKALRGQLADMRDEGRPEPAQTSPTPRTPPPGAEPKPGPPTPPKPEPTPTPGAETQPAPQPTSAPKSPPVSETPSSVRRSPEKVMNDFTDRNSGDYFDNFLNGADHRRASRLRDRVRSKR